MTLNNVDSHKSKFGTGGDCDIEEEQAARERAFKDKRRWPARRWTTDVVQSVRSSLHRIPVSIYVQLG